MIVAIIGYGKMGREIEKILLERGHTVGAIVDLDGGGWAGLPGCDVALEFTQPDTAFENIKRCLDAGVAVVSGTTGWTARLEELQAYCREKNGAFFYASNYCLGVNLMFHLNRQLARMAAHFEGVYNVSIEEVHHIHKKDAPSGTAITLQEGIIACHPEASESETRDLIPIFSIREGEIPGIHTVTYESEDDKLQLRHEIKNRRTLAQGAVIAAEFLCGKRGVYSMDDILQMHE